ncbi:MAG: hypothetical protein WC788_00745 [Candidatus Paceibacterota bacterium]|jgi:hypothetical protein
MKFRILFIFTIIIFTILVFADSYNVFSHADVYYTRPDLDFWSFKSVDTMKYSRDLSREKMEDKDFDAVIDDQVKNIAAIGSTHVAIATPYDSEFIPMLKRWVGAARKYKLKVWFRGNFSGWEEWFDYSRITKEEHLRNTGEFIRFNSDLFEDGDIFSSCPECENGGPGDPRSTGDVEGFREFIIGEYREAKSAFKSINKKVQANYFSMNADVARFVMDEETTEALDGIVTIDHYVSTPEQLAQDVEDIASGSGGSVVLGEFGAPIPDIHGDLSESEQAKWVERALWILKDSGKLKGINYWTAVGGSTSIWGDDGKEKEAAGVLNKYYDPKTFYGVVYNELDEIVPDAKVSYSGKYILSDTRGYFEFPYLDDVNAVVKISARGYLNKELAIDPAGGQAEIVLVKESKDLGFRLEELVKKILFK